MKQTCQGCGAQFEWTRRRKSCPGPDGERCKKRLQRAKVTPLPTGNSGLTAATKTELSAVGKLDSALGQQALALASRIESAAADTGSSIAALSKELRAVMESALSDVQATADPLDELREWRDRKRAAAR